MSENLESKSCDLDGERCISCEELLAKLDSLLDADEGYNRYRNSLKGKVHLFYYEHKKALYAIGGTSAFLGLLYYYFS